MRPIARCYEGWDNCGPGTAAIGRSEPTRITERKLQSSTGPPSSAKRLLVARNDQPLAGIKGCRRRDVVGLHDYGCRHAVAPRDGIDGLARCNRDPPSQLQSADDVVLRSTDLVTSGAPERPGPGAAEFTATDVAERGCGACAVCACGIDAVSSGLLREANGLSFKR